MGSLRKLALTLWSGITIDAGDSTDVEKLVNMTTILSAEGLDADVLMRLRDAHFLLTLGTETGSADFTLDSFSVSRDGGINERIVQYYAKQFIDAGEYQIPIEEPLGFGINTLRLNVTVGTLDASNKFASSKLELHGNLWIP